MNIIEHLTRTVTPVLLNNANDENRSSLLEKLYAIMVARLADGTISNSFANATIADDDHGFFDRVLPDTTHRTELVQQLSRHYSVPEQETSSLVSRAAPLVLEGLRYQVVLPETKCCGRPLLSKGMMDKARRNARSNV